ncbi:acetylcholinesterase-1-like [Amblyomma americanum]
MDRCAEEERMPRRSISKMPPLQATENTQNTDPELAVMKARIQLGYFEDTPERLGVPASSAIATNPESAITQGHHNPTASMQSFWSMYVKKASGEHQQSGTPAYLACCVASMLIVAVFTLIIARYLSTKNGEVLVRGPFGIVHGSAMSCEGREVHAFRGVPFAEPPLGELRFRDPRVSTAPLDPDTIYDGTRPPAACIQLSDMVDRNGVRSGDMAEGDAPSWYRGREDCLSLSIWKPPGDCQSSGQRAVIFVVHGHFFQRSLVKNEGRCLAALGDVVVVAPRYRLGVMGFLNAPPEAPGNVGLADLVLAMNWTKTYVQYFCGDATNIVALGHNSGASAVGYLLHNQPIFNVTRAILINETPFTRYFDNTISASSNVATVAKRLRCVSNATMQRVLHCIRNASAVEVLESGVPGHIPVFFPSYNHPLMSFAPYDRGNLSRPNRIDMLIGYTDGELYDLADSLWNGFATTLRENTSTAFLAHLGVESATEIARFYQKAVLTLPKNVSADDADDILRSDVLHACPVRFYGKFLSRGFNRISSFVLPRETLLRTEAAGKEAQRQGRDDDLERALGTFLSDHPPGSDDGDRARLSRALVVIWSSFAKAGRLPAVNNASWPRVTGYSFPVVSVTAKALTLLNDSHRDERCQFLEPRLLL